MTVRSLRTLDQLFIRDDGQLGPDEAKQLVDSSRDHGVVAADERTELQTIASSSRTTLAARNVIESFLAPPPPIDPPPLASITGYDPGKFSDDRLVLVQLVNRRVVGRLDADQQRRWHQRRRRLRENALQHARRDLAAAAAAVRQRGQADGRNLGSVHRGAVEGETGHSSRSGAPAGRTGRRFAPADARHVALSGKTNTVQVVAAGRSFSWTAVRRSISGPERPGHADAPSPWRGGCDERPRRH